VRFRSGYFYFAAYVILVALTAVKTITSYSSSHYSLQFSVILVSRNESGHIIGWIMKGAHLDACLCQRDVKPLMSEETIIDYLSLFSVQISNHSYSRICLSSSRSECLSSCMKLTKPIPILTYRSVSFP
jgi:hypothetical protein